MYDFIENAFYFYTVIMSEHDISTEPLTRDFATEIQIRTLKTKCWFSELLAESGYKTANSLENGIGYGKIVNTYGEKVRSTQFPCYESGKVRPRDGTVIKISKQFPKSKFWFFMPFWETLWDRTITIEVVHELMKNLTPEITERFFSSDTMAPSIFIRKTKHLKSQIRWLIKNANIESFNMLVLLLLEAELQNNIRRGRLLANYVRIYFALINFGYSSKHFNEALYNIVKNRFVYNWLFPYALEKDPLSKILLDTSFKELFSHMEYVYQILLENHKALALEKLPVLRKALGQVLVLNLCENYQKNQKKLDFDYQDLNEEARKTIPQKIGKGRVSKISYILQ